jgi:exodeoxyribonuclease VII small subunit
MSKLTFENAVKKLEQTVKELESGELPLDKTLSLYEDGIKLTAYCEKLLKEAEIKISKLIQDENGEMKEIDFINEGNKNE